MVPPGLGTHGTGYVPRNVELFASLDWDPGYDYEAELRNACRRGR